MYSFARDAVTKYHALHGLNSRNLFSRARSMSSGLRQEARREGAQGCVLALQPNDVGKERKTFPRGDLVRPTDGPGGSGKGGLDQKVIQKCKCEKRSGSFVCFFTEREKSIFHKEQ